MNEEGDVYSDWDGTWKTYESPTTPLMDRAKIFVRPTTLPIAEPVMDHDGEPASWEGCCS